MIAAGVVRVARPLITYALYPENIPAELRRRPQWVTWEAARKPDKVKIDKIPKIAGSDRNASTTDLMTWATFERCLVDVRRGTKDGLGFVFCSADPYTGIDWDHCVGADGGIGATARDEARGLNTYCERSVSGTGIHGIVRGKVSAAVKRDGVEMYSQDRFFTFTGDVVELAGD